MEAYGQQQDHRPDRSGVLDEVFLTPPVLRQRADLRDCRVQALVLVGEAGGLGVVEKVT